MCRLIDRTRELAAEGEDTPTQAARVRKASACVELALHALDGRSLRRRSEGGEAWIESRIADYAGRLASGPAERPGPGPAARPAARPEGFVGSSAVIPLPELLSFLRAQGKTGLLRVKLEHEVIRLHLRDGDLAHALSDNPPPGLRLGEILVEQGVIDSWLLEKVLAEGAAERSNGSRVARIEQLATREQLRSARAFQIQHLFHRLFEAEDALFAFQEGGQLAGGSGGRMNLIQLLLESARFQDERNSDQRAGPPTWTPGATGGDELAGWLFDGEVAVEPGDAA